MAPRSCCLFPAVYFLPPASEMTVKRAASARRMIIEKSIAPWFTVTDIEAAIAAPPAVAMYGQTVIPAFCIQVAMDTAMPEDACETAPPAPFKIHGMQIENASPQINAPR